MKALILAAGYATRLRPLTDTIPKQLLPVGGRPVVDWIVDKVEEVGEVDELHLVTNARFAPAFEQWAEQRGGGLRPHVHDDGTSSNEDRLGAIGDIQFAIDQGGLVDDDLLAIAGDNLFEYSLAEYVAWWRERPTGSGIAVLDVHDKALASQYGIVELDADNRVTSFVEKPTDPPTTLSATASYLYPREHLPLIRQFLDEGNPPDQSGNLVQWLHTREPVYAYEFEGAWFDIGDKEQLLIADNHFRRAQGLPERGEYSPD